MSVRFAQSIYYTMASQAKRKNGKMHPDWLPSKQKKMQRERKKEAKRKWNDGRRLELAKKGKWKKRGNNTRPSEKFFNLFSMNRITVIQAWAQIYRKLFFPQCEEWKRGRCKNCFFRDSERASERGKECHIRFVVVLRMEWGRSGWLSEWVCELNYIHSMVWFVIVWVCSVLKGFEFSDKAIFLAFSATPMRLCRSDRAS